MRNKRISLIILAIIISIVWVSQTLSFNRGMHRDLNERIVQRVINNFFLNDYLINELEFTEGIKTVLKEGSKEENVIWWLGEGGDKEDEPESWLRYPTNTARNNRHFHDPLEDWNNAGLRTPIFAAESSLMWAQNQNQDVGGKWSWYDARKYFYEGLTSVDKADRDASFAKTFRALGQLMHLIQDVSVPSHTRNDIHAIYHYESWVEDVRNNWSGKYNNWISTPKTYDRAILDLPQNPLAPIPIAKIIDTDKYTRDNQDIESTKSSAIGLAEYSNGNFFSEDTSFAGWYPFPNWACVETVPYQIVDPRDPLRTVSRQYYKKDTIVGCGEANGGLGYRLATVGFLKDYVLTYFPTWATILRAFEKPALDAKVYGDYASLLMPRAVGYSAGILEYFFRGKLEVTPVESNSVKIKNLSSEDMNGIFALFYDATDGNRKPVTNGLWTFSLKAGNISNPLTFTEPADIADTGKYVLVFQGQLGNESKAVVGKIFSMNYHWAIVVNRPPSWRYSARTTEISGTWKDCGPAQGCVMNATVIDSCPSASFNTYLIGSNQFLPNGTFYGGNERCDINLTSKYVGKFMKEDFLSKIYFQIDTHEEYWRQVIDDYRNLVCTLNDGTTAYPIDIYINLKNGSLAPLSWAELSLNAPELIVIKNILFPGQTITSAFKSSNFSDGGYGEWKYFSDSFSYPVTLFMVDVLSRISQDESTACYCFYTCECPNCPDFCVRVVGTIPYAGPISVYKDVKISISDVGFEFGPF